VFVKGLDITISTQYGELTLCTITMLKLGRIWYQQIIMLWLLTTKNQYMLNCKFTSITVHS